MFGENSDIHISDICLCGREVCPGIICRSRLASGKGELPPHHEKIFDTGRGELMSEEEYLAERDFISRVLSGEIPPQKENEKQ